MLGVPVDKVCHICLHVAEHWKHRVNATYLATFLAPHLLNFLDWNFSLEHSTYERVWHLYAELCLDKDGGRHVDKGVPKLPRRHPPHPSGHTQINAHYRSSPGRTC